MIRRMTGAFALVLATATMPAVPASARPVPGMAGEKNMPIVGRIAYSVGALLPDPDPSAGSQVFTVNPDGTDIRQLTHVAAPTQAGDPNYSPDGKWIVYVSNPSGTFQIWLMRSDGSSQHRLARDPGHDAFVPRWSPDGTQLIFTRCTKPFGFLECTIASVHSDGTGARDLTGGHWVDFDARYSPDGRSIAFSSNRDGLQSAIWLTTPEGQTPHRLTAARREAFWPDYSRDGRTILFTDGFARPVSHPFTMRHNGRSVARIGHFAPGEQGAFAGYSPDGARIALDLITPDGESLAVMNVDGTNRRVIVPTGNLTLSDWGPQQ